MTAVTRTDAPVEIEGDGVELRMRDIGGGTEVAFVRFPKGTDMRRPSRTSPTACARSPTGATCSRVGS